MINLWNYFFMSLLMPFLVFAACHEILVSPSIPIYLVSLGWLWLLRIGMLFKSAIRIWNLLHRILGHPHLSPGEWISIPWLGWLIPWLGSSPAWLVPILHSRQPTPRQRLEASPNSAGDFCAEGCGFSAEDLGWLTLPGLVGWVGGWVGVGWLGCWLLGVGLRLVGVDVGWLVLSRSISKHRTPSSMISFDHYHYRLFFNPSSTTVNHYHDRILITIRTA